MERIVSMHWNNIDGSVVNAQRRVFARLGYAIEQHNRDGMDHGAFLDETMAGLGADDVALFVDVDCFALDRAVVERAFAAARAGRLFGCAQSSNHIDPDRVFAGPMFLAIARRSWDAIGRPSFRADRDNDVGQRLHDVARAAGVEVDLLYPWACVAPKWRLADIALFGVGTFYRGGVFHLFESRRSPYAFVLTEVADAVIKGRPVDPLALIRRAQSIAGRERWARRLTRWRRKLSARRFLAAGGPVATAPAPTRPAE